MVFKKIPLFVARLRAVKTCRGRIEGGEQERGRAKGGGKGERNGIQAL
jgi:hypothetical protein